VVVVLVVAAVLVIAGGSFGYWKSGSVESLLVAGAAGLVWLVCAAGVARGSAWAPVVAGVVALALAAGMAWRLAGGASAGVALPVIAISTAVLVVLVTARRLAP
jgi:uncharacterized membrane protein (UPF0136 family)